MFAVGILAGLGALVLEFIISIIYPGFDSGIQAISFPLIISAVIEESLKFGMIRKIFDRFKISFFLNSILIGLGFAAAEFFFNVLRHSSELGLFHFSYLGLFLIHSATAAIFGYYFLKHGDSILSGFFILSLAAILHFSFNTAVILGLNYGIIYLTLSILIIILVHLARKSYPF